jgi:DNA polymerase-3 subunit alpha
LRIFVDKLDSVHHVAKRLEGDGEGVVRFVCLLPDRRQEVEIQLPGRYRVTAAIAGAVKSVPGVIHIENAGSH